MLSRIHFLASIHLPIFASKTAIGMAAPIA